MRSILILTILLLSLATNAQRFSSDEWHKGFLVTTDQDTIRGLVKYNMETNIVLVSRNNVVQSFSSQKIFYVEILDKLVKNYRQFYSISYNVRYDYKVPILFELMYEGPLSLLARESVVTELVNSGMSVYSSTIRQNVLNLTFYFLDKKGNMKIYSGRKQDLYVILAKKELQVRDFIKKNKLDPSELTDLIRITAFYNSL